MTIGDHLNPEKPVTFQVLRQTSRVQVTILGFGISSRNSLRKSWQVLSSNLPTSILCTGAFRKKFQEIVVSHDYLNSKTWSAITFVTILIVFLLLSQVSLCTWTQPQMLSRPSGHVLRLLNQPRKKDPCDSESKDKIELLCHKSCSNKKRAIYIYFVDTKFIKHKSHQISSNLISHINPSCHTSKYPNSPGIVQELAAEPGGRISM